jgi:hypothetical protein
MLKVILQDLKSKSLNVVQAFPRRTISKDCGEHWKGPENMYLAADFKVKRDDSKNPILEIRL